MVGRILVASRALLEFDRNRWRRIIDSTVHTDRKFQQKNKEHRSFPFSAPVSLVWNHNCRPHQYIPSLLPYWDITSYYLRFLKVKTNGHHIGMLHVVPILIHLSSTVSQFAAAYQISSQSNNAQRSCDVISIFQDGAAMASQIYFRLWF